MLATCQIRGETIETAHPEQTSQATDHEMMDLSSNDERSMNEMGYYIQTPENKNKAAQIESLHGGEIVSQPASFASIPADKALICVVDNSTFEAAAFCYSASEFDEFSQSNDIRPRKWVLMPRELAVELSGLRE